MIPIFGASAVLFSVLRYLSDKSFQGIITILNGRNGRFRDSSLEDL